MTSATTAGGGCTLFLAGDVMLGRGVDQLLAHPGRPELRERSVRDARTYLDLAARVTGPVPRPVDWSWPWGVVLDVLDEAGCDLRLINLETAVTTSDDFAPGKAVHYRMHPSNLAALSVARPDLCVLANNHVLDFGRRGLLETLDALAAAGLRTVGAGRTRAEAAAPVARPTRTGGRLVVLAFATPSSGTPTSWAASDDRPGVQVVERLTESAAQSLAEGATRERRPGDIVVVSAHWGSNWGWTVPDEQVRFAHQLVEAGVDLVYGHSSHHPRPVEVYRGKLIAYGCGDLLNDYEGIRGHEEYRDDLRLLHLVRLSGRGDLIDLRLVPLQTRQLRLLPAAEDDVRWLRAALDRACRPVGTGIEIRPDGSLGLRFSG